MGVMQYRLDAGLIEDPPNPALTRRGALISNQSDVENTGDIPVFVRVMAFPTLVAADGLTLLEMQLGDQLQLSTMGAPGALGARWADGGDGYYYYLDLLAPGETTGDPLFDEVKLSADIAGTQTGAKLNLALVVESVDGTDDFYRGAWWGGAIPAGGPLKDVDDALQTDL